MSTKLKSIFVVVTTYNEKENLPALVPQILDKDSRLKVIIVDDSSPDGTGKIADDLAKIFKDRITVIHRKERGVGTALREGFKKALALGAEAVIQMDADFSHNPFYLPEIIKTLESGAKVVIGSRYSSGGGIASRSVARNIISKIANLYNHIILGLWDVSDTASGYKGYQREVLEKINLGSFVSTGYSVGVENLYRIAAKGFKITEIPILFSDRNAGNSKMGLKELVKYMITVLKIRAKS